MNSFASFIMFVTSLLSQNPSSTGEVMRKVDFACSTEWATTSFYAKTENQKIKVNLVNHNGVKYMPIHSGLITSNDIGIIARKAEALKTVGDSVEFNLNPNKCRLHKDGTFNCADKAFFKGTDGKDIEVFSFSSSFNQQKFMDMTFDQTTLLLGVIIKEETYFIQMSYYPYECGMSLE